MDTDSTEVVMPPGNSDHKSSGQLAAIHWFRHGLRLHDNPALLEALEYGGEFYPIFIFDGEVAGTNTAGYNRMRFLLESLQDLDNSLKKHGGRLYVFHGDPTTILRGLFNEWSVGRLTFEQDPEAVWHARDNAVKELCQEVGVECVEKISHTLWDPNEYGETGYPWIDAIMRQLRQEGWVHHVARHAVATFLTRGDLWISWESGLEYLIDADWSVCAGNWMWMASSAFEKVLSCPKCFCPVRYGRKLDPKGEYVRRYVPELKDMPLKYLFEPWTAPKEVQQAAKCIIGVDYPHPIVEHAKASKDCYNRMRDIKNKLVLQGRDIEHCRPANSEEVGQFVLVPGEHKGHTGCRENAVSENDLCDGLIGM